MSKTFLYGCLYLVINSVLYASNNQVVSNQTAFNSIENSIQEIAKQIKKNNDEKEIYAKKVDELWNKIYNSKIRALQYSDGKTELTTSDALSRTCNTPYKPNQDPTMVITNVIEPVEKVN